MADAVAEITAPDRLRELVGRLERQEGFAEAVASLKADTRPRWTESGARACALVAATLAARPAGPLVVVCPRADEVDALVDDLGLFLGRNGRTVSRLRNARRRAGRRRTRRPASGCGC